MAQQTVNDADFINHIEKYGILDTARRLGLHPRTVQRRRVGLEQRLRREIVPPAAQTGPGSPRNGVQHPHRIPLDIKNGIVLVGSDAHYWPHIVTTAHRAFVKFCRDLQPKAVVLNGDVIDGASISRHPPINWEQIPDVAEEIDTAKERVAEIEKAAPNAKRIWTLGNHDGRFETRLAVVAPEYARVHGVHLKDHFPYWHPCWSTWINDTVVIKHRFKAGIHAPHNNAMWAGRTIITGHLHSLKVMPLSDYNGTRWGVDSGTLAEPYGPQFVGYTEDSPVNWRSGFIVLTFHKGTLLWPEIVRVFDENHVDFRGEVVKV